MKTFLKFCTVGSVAVFLLVPSLSRAATVEELQAQIQALLQQIAALQAQLSEAQGIAPQRWCHDFNQNLGVGNSGDEVRALQRALRLEGFDPGADGDFDEKTAAAVSGFQEKYRDEILKPLGLSSPTGYLGRATRAKLNQLYGCAKPKSGDLKVLSPNGGEMWQAGTTRVIRWSAPSFIQNVDIKIFSAIVLPCLTPAAVCPTIANPTYTIWEGVANTGSFEWEVGSVKGFIGILTGQYVVRIQSSFDANSGTNVDSDVSDAAFTITNSTTSNQPPVIMKTGGPTSLKVNEAGTWTIVANDPEGGTLSYRVVWGDKTLTAPTAPGVAEMRTAQTATFTHSYATAGVYYPTFTVTDANGQSAKTTIRVDVVVTNASIPSPQIQFLGTESYTDAYGTPSTRYKLAVSNWASFPAELFVAAPDLPPCGLNTSASRTWVNIYNSANDSYIYGFCGLNSPKDLTSLWFGTEQGATSPAGSVYIIFIDRRTGENYRSNSVAVATTYAKPDLTVLDIYDDSGKLSVKVGNIGASPAANAGNLYLWIDDQLKWTYSLSTLYSQQVFVGDTRVIQPQTLSGSHKIKAVIDPTNVIDESDENNNTLEKTVTFGGGTTTNLPPVIMKMDGPTSLKTGETGTWTIVASDPEQKPLSYSVIWGDEPAGYGGTVLPQQVGVYNQTATFTHSYANPGTYTPIFVVRDHANLAARSVLTVQVGGSLAKLPDFTIKSIKAGGTDFVVEICNEGSGTPGSFGYFNSLEFRVDANGVSQTLSYGAPLATPQCVSLHSWGFSYYGVAPGWSGGVFASVDPTNAIQESNELNNDFKDFLSVPKTSNLPPSITGVSGPTVLSVGQTGTWTVTAKDPESKSLRYAVSWGEVIALGGAVAESSLAPTVYTQTATFTHAYANAGLYTVTVRVYDDVGLTSTTSLTVSVTR